MDFRATRSKKQLRTGSDRSLMASGGTASLRVDWDSDEDGSDRSEDGLAAQSALSRLQAQMLLNDVPKYPCSWCVIACGLRSMACAVPRPAPISTAPCATSAEHASAVYTPGCRSR